MFKNYSDQTQNAFEIFEKKTNSEIKFILFKAVFI